MPWQHATWEAPPTSACRLLPLHLWFLQRITHLEPIGSLHVKTINHTLAWLVRHAPLLVMGSFSKSALQMSWHMWLIGFLTRQKAYFDGPNTTSVASTNTSLQLLFAWARPPTVLLTELTDDADADYFFPFIFCSHYCNSARMAMHQHGLHSHCWFFFI